MIFLLALSLMPSLANAQADGAAVGLSVPKGVSRAEPVSGETSAVELPYSQILRDTDPPYDRLFRDVRVGGRLTPKAGSADALFESRLFGGTFLRTPIDRRVEPTDAELKLGPFFLDVRYLSGSLLASDNVNLTETDREAGVIGIVRLHTAAMLQLGDALQFRVAGTLVWLPFEGEIGVAGFGVRDPLASFQGAGPLTKAQMTYDLRLGGWDIHLFDDLEARARRFGDELSIDLLEGEHFDEEDRAGRYVFRDKTPPGGGGTDSREGRWGVDFYQVRNLVGASIGRLLPTETRFEFGGHHTDYLYSGGEGGVLPSSRDSAYVMLASERETLRFKPFAYYRVYKYDYQDNWDQEGHAGIQGPVTENLHFLGQLGYLEPGGAEGGRLLWKARLRHTINPLTFHQLFYHRGTTEPDRGIYESWGYRIRHVFRSNLAGQLYAIHSTFEGLSGFAAPGEEDRIGLLFTYDLAQRTLLRVGGAYTRFAYEDPDYTDSDTWTARAEVSYRVKKWLEARLLYQFRDRDWSAPVDTTSGHYHENLVVLTMVAYF